MERRLHQAQKFEAIGTARRRHCPRLQHVVGAIPGWAEVGREENRDNATAVERCSRIRDQAQRAAALTRELLAFARRQVLQPRSVTSTP
jgi:hypothetical protein